MFISTSYSTGAIVLEVKRGKLELPISIQELARRIERGGVIELVPVDTAIWLRSLELPWEHADPADRVIVATALARGTPLLTKDATIRASATVACIW